jgi:hypothetical protein
MIYIEQGYNDGLSSTDKFASIIEESTGNNISLALDENGNFIMTNDNGDVAEQVISFNSNGDAVFTGKITAGEIEANSIKGLDIITNQISLLTEEQQGFAVNMETMDDIIEGLSLAQGDIIALQANLGDFEIRLNDAEDTVSGLVINNTELNSRLDVIEATLSSGILGALAINTLDVTGNSNFLGTVTFGQQAIFNLPPIWNIDTAGFALVKAGDKRVRVEFENAYIATPVVSATMAFNTDDSIDDTAAAEIFGANLQSLVVEKDQSGFTILLNKNAPRDIRFSWTALAVNDPNIFESVFEGLTIEEPTPPPQPEPTPSPAPEPQPEPTPTCTDPQVLDSQTNTCVDPVPTPEPEPTPELPIPSE